jgi:hypothetical protein
MPVGGARSLAEDLRLAGWPNIGDVAAAADRGASTDGTSSESSQLYSVYDMYYNIGMAKKTRDKILTFRPDSDMFAAMQRLRERHATPFAEQLRRALRTWLAEQPAAWPVEEKKANLRRAAREGRTR